MRIRWLALPCCACVPESWICPRRRGTCEFCLNSISDGNSQLNPDGRSVPWARGRIGGDTPHLTSDDIPGSRYSHLALRLSCRTPVAVLECDY